MVNSAQGQTPPQNMHLFIFCSLAYGIKNNKLQTLYEKKKKNSNDNNSNNNKKTIFKLLSQTMNVFFVAAQRPLVHDKWFTFLFLLLIG